MNDDAAGYIGSIPQHYDRSLGPLICAVYAADISHRVAACNPVRVLETAAGTGSRRLRDVLPASVRLTATNFNPAILEVARTISSRGAGRFPACRCDGIAFRRSQLRCGLPIQSTRRECIDHMILMNEGHLRHILSKYASYYNEARTHLALGKDAPCTRPVERFGDIIAQSILGGLHYRYARICIRKRQECFSRSYRFFVAAN